MKGHATMRFNFTKETPQVYDAMLALNTAISQANPDSRLVHLTKIRASQINGCAYCVNMHVKEAQQDGLPDMLLHLIAVWRETSAFTARDRAALAWAETLTRLEDSEVSQADFDAARAEFSEQEVAALTASIAMINLWNRMAISAHLPV
ncbi:4-carboxymuconolactone decarboxylase domain/alkylhydroperoxidase AhpD family core domain protein [Ruegeria pomeroyi DSS-3]|uniref:4-carboxymuconolactone decarboxylase domain/alkylhydroperoxidase AhpD family core domain protein n=3 Tax=Ruegeria pomeroyi TaxID=89184 RepID=Q5LTM2_RUEPO|nr:carboxymuconolactone decarboxylase family protein [Ruegeria pomeroyi]AAV94679.1 4-carboxymuconolactone decarboxylase domain/alkylhydroperoxidase AhpD family core domain protein [Ruegeria pomeroyi DSS-3]NVK95809.1 carboxymuconolactone decarboxylase family protein [Ruegeria pomeroyi]